MKFEINNVRIKTCILKQLYILDIEHIAVNQAVNKILIYILCLIIFIVNNDVKVLRTYLENG